MRSKWSGSKTGMFFSALPSNINFLSDSRSCCNTIEIEKRCSPVSVEAKNKGSFISHSCLFVVCVERFSLMRHNLSLYFDFKLRRFDVELARWRGAGRGAPKTERQLE
ncbi:hypothetical protein EVAR_15726_1 [Eumeta japonica]|uniref:Uncharacterized protein n=1 Tax=Eumeta variegata TaxID=151549 RepID=A0A4C1U9L0_EUMVA|nr:hypothetical protein EVAR_15726_1 [Eumeta japonica]